MPETSFKFKAGDLVRLKGGGPVMTLVSIDMHRAIGGSSDAQIYNCKWFSGKKLEYSVFSEASLIPVDEDGNKVDG